MDIVRKEMRVRPVAGDVGVEIEVEGNNLPASCKGWRAEADGSLRGEAREYVFDGPKSLTESYSLIDSLCSKLNEDERTILDTGRAGVHVHINCQDLKMGELYNFFVLYLCLEPALTEFCGESRVGNHFCLRAIDAEGLLFHLINAARDGNRFRRFFGTDTVRYSAMNVRSLTDYGSVEFRAMRSTTDPAILKTWVGLLYTLKQKAKEFASPSEVMMRFSMNGGEDFVKDSLGEFAPVVLEQAGWEEMVVEGMRAAQDVAFATDWSKEWFDEPLRIIGQIKVPYGFDDDFPPEDV